MKFEKWHGLGNDFILLRDIEGKIRDKGNLAIQLCNRNLGIGADGLAFILSSERGDYRMQIFNPDGSEAEMCGNAIRCVTKSLNKPSLNIETSSGIRECVLLDNGMVRVNMGSPSQLKKQDGLTSLSMGNPHVVVYVDSFDTNWEKQGESISNRTDLFPEKTNVEFVKVVDKKNIEVRVWERGVGSTLACGTGACASVVVGIEDKNLDREVTVSLSGGKLLVSWPEKGGEIYMTGEAVKVFEGNYNLPNFEH